MNTSHIRNWVGCSVCLMAISMIAFAAGNETNGREIEAEMRLQADEAVTLHMTRMRRIENVMIGLRTAAAPNCIGWRHLDIGIRPMEVSVFPRSLWTAAARIYGLDDHAAELAMATAAITGASPPEVTPHVSPPLFLVVPKTSPAYVAGIREGDELVTLAGYYTFPYSMARVPKFERILAEELTLVRSGARQTVGMDVRRNGAVLHVEITPHWLCDYTLKVMPLKLVNAFNLFKDGWIPTGLADYLEDDNELALVLGHELAHSVLRHSQHKAVAQAEKETLSAETLQEMESDADRLGLHFAALAGFDVGVAARLWHRWGVDAYGTTPLVDGESDHPPSAQRAIVLRDESRTVADSVRARRSVVIDHTRMHSYFSGDARKAIAVGMVRPYPSADVATSVANRLDPMLPDTLALYRPGLPAWDEVPASGLEGLIAYQDYLLDNREPRTFAISSTGEWGAGYGKAADSEALIKCKRAAPGGTGRIYLRSQRLTGGK